MGTVMVLGATGFTGSLVSKDIAARDVPFVLAARNREKLDALNAALPAPVETRVASPADPASLKNLFDGIDVVINTVGPFNDYGEPVVRAAVEQNTHYLDTTGEQDYMLRMIENYDAEARRKERVVICAQAFEYAVGECAAALVLQAFGNRADSLEVFNFVSGGGASKGTVKSAFRMFGRPALVWKDGKLVQENMGAEVIEVKVPGEGRTLSAVVIPGGEPLNVHRYADVGYVRTCIGLPPRIARAVKYGNAALALTRFSAVRGLMDLAVDRFHTEPTAAELAEVGFRVVVRACKGREEKFCIVAGKDPYGITAKIAVEGALLLLEKKPLQCGVVSTAMAFDPKEFLDRLAPHGVTWRVV